METLLEAAREQRQIHLQNLPRWQKTHVADATYEIKEEDMRTIYNRWRWDVESWMNEENRKTYHDLGWKKRKPVEAQQMQMDAFDVYKSELAGSKFLLHKLIQLPIIAQCNATPSDSAEQPASLMKCINDLHVYMQTDEYKASVRIAQKRTQDDRRLSREIWKANWWLARGKELSMTAGNGDTSQLKKWERRLANQYDDGKLERSLKDLLNQRTRG